MTAQLLPNVVQQFRDSNGNVLAGGKLWSYQAGTTTPLATYTDETAGTPNTNPVTLDSSGAASVWLGASAYKFVLKDSSGNTIWTVDSVSIINPNSVDSTKIDSSIAGVGLAQNVSTKAIDAQYDNSTIGVNESNQLYVKTGGITGTQLSSTAVDTTKLSSSVEVVTKLVRDYSCPGIFQTIPQYGWSTPTLIGTPGTIPPAAASCAKWSFSGEFLAVGTSSSPYVDIYQRTAGNTLVKLANPGTLPTGAVTDVSWSPCADFLACAHTTTPFVTIYQRTGNTFTKLANPGTLPGHNGTGVAFSPNSDFLLVAENGISLGTRIVNIYERSGTTFTFLTTLPNLNPTSWYPDSSMVAMNTGGATGHVNIFSRSDSTFTDITPVSISALSNVNAHHFSPDGAFFAVGLSVSPYIALFSVSGTTFTAISNPVALPPDNVACVAWSPNSQYVLFGHSTTPFMTIYSVSGTTFTKVSDPGVLPAAAVSGADWNKTKQFLAVASGTSPYIQVYQTASSIPSNGIFWTKGVTNV